MGAIKFPHASGNSTSISSPAANPSANIELKLPSTTGSAGQVLKVASANHSSTNAELEWGAVSVNSSTDTFTVTGQEGTSASLYLVADEGDDNGDGWRINSNQDANDITFSNNSSGSYVDKFTIGSNGQPGFDFGSTYAYFNKENTGVIVEFRTGGSAKGNIGIGGSDVSYNTSSDYRLKENVAAISDGITRVKQLKPSKFNWISDDTNTLIDGFLAHEVSSVVPSAVTGAKDAVDSDSNPVHQVIDQSKMIPLLTAALKEAITKIETLESKVAALEGS